MNRFDLEEQAKREYPDPDNYFSDAGYKRALVRFAEKWIVDAPDIANIAIDEAPGEWITRPLQKY